MPGSPPRWPGNCAACCPDDGQAPRSHGSDVLIFLHTLRGIAKMKRICNTLKRDKNIPFFYILTLYSS